MAILFESEFPDPGALFVRDPESRMCEWQGRKALRLSGQGACLLVLPDLSLSQGWVEVEIGTEGAAFPGIAFRLLDSLNYELAYAQPHTSGKWDAIQYDPVFHGSNTWQLYHGPGSQQQAQVPLGDWFRLRVEFQDHKAVIWVGEQEPLLVSPLAHNHLSGLVGLWTYLPAFFSYLRVGNDPSDYLLGLTEESQGTIADGIVDSWFLEGFGVVDTEPSGILNLNRYLPVSTKEVKLTRQIALPLAGELQFTLGFSDEVEFQVDGEVIFRGENLFKDSPRWEERGYVSLDRQVTHPLSSGTHQLTAVLKAKEYFGYGMALRIEGDKYRLLPADLQT